MNKTIRMSDIPKVKLSPEEKKAVQAQKWRDYQREYKKKKYHEDVEAGRSRAKKYYLKSSGKVEGDDVEKFGDYCCDVRAAINILKRLKGDGKDDYVKVIIESIE